MFNACHPLKYFKQKSRLIMKHNATVNNSNHGSFEASDFILLCFVRFQLFLHSFGNLWKRTANIDTRDERTDKLNILMRVKHLSEY